MNLSNEPEITKNNIPPIKELETAIGYTFKKHIILQEALTHPSVHVKKKGVQFNYERLEFLGDAILDFVISNLVFSKHSKEDEGFLSAKTSALISRETCYKVGKGINIGNFLLMSKGEEQNAGRKLKTNLANAVEALIAAIFIDSGEVSVAAKIIERLWKKMLDEVTDVIDPKTKLQEWSQGKLSVLPKYSLINTSGPSHNMNFVIEVSIGNSSATGLGKSKKLAEKNAAENFLLTLEKEKGDPFVAPKKVTQGRLNLK